MSDADIATAVQSPPPQRPKIMDLAKSVDDQMNSDLAKRRAISHMPPQLAEKVLREEIGAMAMSIIGHRRKQLGGTEITANDFARVEEIIRIAMDAKPVIGALMNNIVPRAEG